jgi:diadenosine tetraphosphate (Ap4A) HIT family hydrolase
VWTDERAWRGLISRSLCPICLEGPKDVVAEFSTSWVTAGPKAPLPGYVAVVCKHHVVEPFDLVPPERGAIWEDVLTTAKILADLFQPVKMNYEIHGNTLPHLHVHLFPRMRDDPFVGGPIDPRKVAFTRSTADLERIGRALKTTPIA